MDNELIEHPIILHVMGVDLIDKSFYEKETWIWPGAVDPAIINELKKSNGVRPKSNKLYGAKFMKTIQGGDDIFDIPELTEEPTKIGFEREVKEGSRKPNKKEAKAKKIEQQEKEKQKEEHIEQKEEHIEQKEEHIEQKSKSKSKQEPKLHVITDYSIYPEDRISEFKEKISLVGTKDIKPFKQHLWCYLEDNIIPMRYKIITDSNNI